MPNQSTFGSQTGSTPNYTVGEVGAYDEWENVADHCETATFFHTPLWYRAFAETYPSYKIKTRRFIFSDGQTAYVPLIEHRKNGKFTKCCAIGLAGCYGGWISTQSLSAEKACQIIGWILKNYHDLVWRINPIDKSAKQTLSPYVSKADTTEILFLDNFINMEAIRRNYKYSVRKEIRKAERNNFCVREAKRSHEWHIYFELYQRALRRWGDRATNNYPIRLFESLFNSENEKIKLWLVYSENEIIGGNLNFYQSKHCVEWHAAFDSRFFGTGARNLLVDRIIADAFERGYSYYDFNPSGGHEGTRRFKQAFGTTQVSTNLIDKHGSSQSLKVFRNVSAMIRGLWQ